MVCVVECYKVAFGLFAGSGAHGTLARHGKSCLVCLGNECLQTFGWYDGTELAVSIEQCFHGSEQLAVFQRASMSCCRALCVGVKQTIDEKRRVGYDSVVLVLSGVVLYCCLYYLYAVCKLGVANVFVCL